MAKSSNVVNAHKPLDRFELEENGKLGKYSLSAVSDVGKKVRHLLETSEITFEARYKGLHSDANGWEHDGWIVRIGDATFDYKTGIGHRGKLKVGWFAQKSPATDYYAVLPTAASVLYSLMLDAQYGEDTFEEFCGSLGYDTDSRRALVLYLECQNIRQKLHKIISADLWKALQNLLEDY